MAGFSPKLPFETYQTDAITLARRLLGCKLFHRTAEGVTGGVIVFSTVFSFLRREMVTSKQVLAAIVALAASVFMAL